MSVDAPARCMWQAIKQFNGYNGCGKCKEPGEQLDLGAGKGNRRRSCHVYPFNKDFAATTGHVGLRSHEEVKRQACQALRERRSGKKKVSVEGVVGLSWGFGLPHYDVILGSVVDYMHCICEGVVDQLLSQWLDKGNSKKSFYLGSKVQEISRELTGITPTCEITRTPRSLEDIKDWKASEKRSFLLYYSVPLLREYLPADHLSLLMLLTGGIFRLLKQSISQEEVEEAHKFLKLFTAQSPVLYDKRFQTFNVHQLLHLSDEVKNLGPLWSNSCFPFEDYNGDLRELFNGTKNIDGQIITGVSIIQKLPEIARKTTTCPEVRAFYEHLTSKRNNIRSVRESIAPGANIVGSLERIWGNSKLLTEEQLAALPRNYGKMWAFKRCLLNGVMLHSKSYKRVTARNDYTVEFEYRNQLCYGLIQIYVKVEDKCHRALCHEQRCDCELPTYYYAIVDLLEKDNEQLPKYKEMTLVNHIVKVKETNRVLAIPVLNIGNKFIKVNVSSGSYISFLPNPYEKD
ncbi:uncharacterized protein LOC110244095 [Exaiptasia diaphana]|uniref:Uncharacterized protein n=1 Tax=Exaiptasia diaphana TaxID=2652724 RepID=A0A913XKN5_EXADI|nr:uncharacterized protein LOC110244095 [Exaiptasia diaphana]